MITQATAWPESREPLHSPCPHSDNPVHRMVVTQGVMKYDKLREFAAFVKGEILPATKDIEKLADANRKHIQKLVYTNLVDRFDSAVDGALLDNCREDELVAAAADQLKQPIIEADLLRLLMRTDDLQTALDDRLADALRQSVLRERHSRKLSQLFRVLQPDQECWNTPRVRITVGTIHSKLQPQRPTVPHSICGFADWLYSRRNSVVHGAGTTQFLPNDRTQIKKLFRCKVAQRVRIQLSSTTAAATFYQSVVDLLLE